LVKTTTFNLVSALADVGLVEHDPSRGAYRLGVGLLAYGRAVERRTDLIATMRPYLLRLCAATRETVNLALPCPTDVLIVDSLEGSQTLRITSYAGTRAAYHSTACGRALLAYGAEATRRQVLALQPLAAQTPLTTTDPAAIEAILADCRRQGFVCEVEENELGAACVGAALLDGSGAAVAAVSIAGPLTRMGPADRERIGALLVETMAEARSRGS
jgi:IclR family acetate operon transcriptional repressor